MADFVLWGNPLPLTGNPVTTNGPYDYQTYQNVCIAVTLPPSAEAATIKIANLRNVPCHWRAVFVDTAAVPLDLEVNQD